MNSINGNKRNEQISYELENGEPLIWDESSESDLDEFMEFAINGLGNHFGYDHSIFGFKDGIEEPYHVATCRGKEFALDCVEMFNNVGLTCAVYPKNVSEILE
jgi:hypothetical protein